MSAGRIPFRPKVGSRGSEWARWLRLLAFLFGNGVKSIRHRQTLDNDPCGPDDNDGIRDHVSSIVKAAARRFESTTRGPRILAELGGFSDVAAASLGARLCESVKAPDPLHHRARCRAGSPRGGVPRDGRAFALGPLCRFFPRGLPAATPRRLGLRAATPPRRPGLPRGLYLVVVTAQFELATLDGCFRALSESSRIWSASPRLCCSRLHRSGTPALILASRRKQTSATSRLRRRRPARRHEQGRTITKKLCNVM